MNPDPTRFAPHVRSYSFAPYFLSVAFNSICCHDPDDPIKSVEIGTGADSMASAEIKTVKGRVYFLKNNPICDPKTGEGGRTFLVLKDTPFAEDVFTVRAW